MENIKKSFENIKTEYEKHLRQLVFSPKKVSEEVDWDTGGRKYEFLCPYCGEKIFFSQTKDEYYASGWQKKVTVRCNNCNRNLVLNDETDITEYNMVCFQHETEPAVIISLIFSKRNYSYDENGIAAFSEWEHNLKETALVYKDNIEVFNYNGGTKEHFKTKASPLKVFPSMLDVIPINVSSINGITITGKRSHNIISEILRSMPKTAAKKAAAPAKQFTPFPVTFAEKDVSSILFKEEKFDTVNYTRSGQCWCTLCDNVWDAKYDTNKDEELVCPNCGAKIKAPHRYSREYAKNIAYVINKGDETQILFYLLSIDNNWSIEATPYYAYSIEKGKATGYRYCNYGQKKWVKASLSSIRFSKIVGNYLHVDRVFCHQKNNYSGVYGNDVKNYIIGAAKNPVIASYTADENNAKKMFEALKNKSSINWKATKPEEIFEVEMSFEDNIDPVKATALVKAEPQIDKKVLEDLAGYNFLLLSSLLFLFSKGISFFEISQYLKRISNEEKIKAEKALEYWTVYIDNKLKLGEDISDPDIKFPKYLHTMYDITQYEKYELYRSTAKANNNESFAFVSEYYKAQTYKDDKIIVRIADKEKYIDGLRGVYKMYKYAKDNPDDHYFIVSRASNNVPFAIVAVRENYSYVTYHPKALTASEKKWLDNFLEAAKLK